MRKLGLFIKQNSILVPITFLGFLILVSAAAVYYNNLVMVATVKAKEETASIKENMNFIIRGIVQRADVSVRGFSVAKDERLLKPYTIAQEVFDKTFENLNRQLKSQNMEVDGLQKIRNAVNDYLVFSGSMITAIKLDSMNTFRAMFKEDRGTALWYEYDVVAKKIIAHQDELNTVAQTRYENAMARNGWIQVFLVLIGIPTLVFIVVRLVKETNERKKLLLEFDKSNRTFLFDDGNEITDGAEGDYIDRSISSFKDAANFVTQLTEGNLDAAWRGITERNISFNKNNLSGKLMALKDQLKTVRKEEEKRNWLNSGLAKFNELVRNHQNSMEDLSYQTIFFLCRYLNAVQGSLFLKRTEGGRTWLELSSCFAYNRKKYISKTIQLGEGLIGQVYLEGETTVITNLPNNYTTITSGLGEATPTCLVIVPMRFNDEIEALVELAGFHKWEGHEIEFLEKAGGFVASVINNVAIAQKMKNLLMETQAQTERLRSQEEELRQNLEEMQATQEQLLRSKTEPFGG
jgi:CHASE3 domain sensor protein